MIHFSGEWWEIALAIFAGRIGYDTGKFLCGLVFRTKGDSNAN